MLSLILSAQAAVPAPLKVMSFNIRYGTANDGPDRWDVRAPRVHALLRRQKADLIGLQEALDFQIDQIRDRLGVFDSVGVGRDDGKRAGEFSAILYNNERLKLLKQGTFWLSDTPQMVASKTWGNGITRICTWAQFRDLATGKTFWHFNTHLDHQSQPSREKSIGLINQMVKTSAKGQPVIVTGDFNSDEANPAVLAMKEGGYRDTWRILNPKADQPGTFNGFRPSYDPSKIDYIFVSPQWRVKKAEVVMEQYRGRWPSDHMPVTADVSL